MGRGKVELKRIADKSSRQVSFSKRRNGLMKKAHELAVLCDVDLALFVFSGKNRLFEYSTGDSSMNKILTRYQSYKNADEIVRRTVHEKLALEFNDVWTADKLMQITQSHLEEHKIQESDISELCQLEKEIESMIQQVRIKKTQVMLGTVKDLQEKQKQLHEEKQFMVGEIMAARMNENNVGG